MRERRVNVCKLLRGQLEPDLKYSMAKSRITKREHGFDICELPNKQWVAFSRRTGSSGSVMTGQCGKHHLNVIGSFHTHLYTKEEKKGLGIKTPSDIVMPSPLDPEPREKIMCVGDPDSGRMACFRTPSKSDIKKIKKLDKLLDNKPLFKAVSPIMRKTKLCETQIEKVSSLKKFKETLKKPNRPPLRF